MMSTIALVARLLLAGVLFLSALAKWRDREATEQAAQAFGLPPGAAKAVGRLLAPIELALAALLLPGITAFAATLGSVALILAFTLAVGNTLRKGQRPACNCFGATSEEPISGWTVARNVGLLSFALVALLVGPFNVEGAIAGIADRIGDAGLAAAVAVLGLAAVMQTAVLLLLLRRPVLTATPTHVGHDEPAPASVGNGWPPGTVAPAFTLESADGLRVSLADLLRRERPVLLVFTDSTCAPCNALLPELADWQELYGDLLTIAVVGAGTIEENRAKRDSLGLRDVLIQGADEVASGYRYLGTPGAVLIGRDGRIASRVASGPGPIRSLVVATVEDLDAPATIEGRAPQRMPVQVPVGEPAPPVRLPAVAGGEVDLSEYQGRMVVILFWSPTCGFCHQIEDAVRSWADGTPEVQLLVIAAGNAAANGNVRIGGPVLLEDDGATMRALGASGTPSAVLVDASGNVASPLAVGTEETLALLKRASRLARAAKAFSVER